MRLLLQESLEILLRMVGWIMHVAPLGVMALLIKLVATQEHGLLLTLAKFVAVIIGTTLLHGLVVLPLLLYMFAGMTPWRFWGGAQKALITAFATSSSSATLPVSLHCAEQHLHIKPDIAGFVLPLGATMNMDGTALYEAGAALFVAQLMGIELNGVQQVIVCLTAMLEFHRCARHPKRRHGYHGHGVAGGGSAGRSHRYSIADGQTARYHSYCRQCRRRHDWRINCSKPAATQAPPAAVSC